MGHEGLGGGKRVLEFELVWFREIIMAYYKKHSKLIIYLWVGAIVAGVDQFPPSISVLGDLVPIVFIEANFF